MSLPAIPGYTLEREIGAGGMARVYLAVQNSLERRVALKVMAPALVADPSFSKRFLLEARTLAGLTHPNIVAVYDVGATEQLLHYFAMQYLDNGDLALRIRKGIPEPELVRILTSIARALGFAHQRGVVHRDVTPGNIMFDSVGNPVLTDFGIARSQHGASRITQTGVSIGTSSYMSPEQARGGEVDRRSDLYSLGALTFEALTGHPPYQGADGFAVAYAHVFEPVPRLPAHLNHWQSFIDISLSKDPNERFDNAEQFVVGLSDVPVQATRIVPQRALLATGKIAAQAAPALRPDTPLPGHVSAPTRSIARVDQQSIEQIKRELKPAAATVTHESGQQSGRQSGQSAAHASPRLGKWLLLASAAAIALGGGGYWLRNRTQAPSFDPVTVAPKPAANAPTTTNASTASNPAPDPVPAFNGESAFGGDPNLAADGLPLVGDALPVGDPLPNQFGPPTPAKWVLPLVAYAQDQTKKNQCFVARGAVEQYRNVLAVDRSNAAAIAGIDACFKLIAPKIDTFLALETPDDAAIQAFLSEFESFQRVAGLAGAASKEALQLIAERKRIAVAFSERGDKANSAWRPKFAADQFKTALRFDPKLGSAAKGVELASKLGQPGYVFRNEAPSGKTPNMTIVIAGSVSLRDERGVGPKINIPAFAVSRNEITLGEYKTFVNASGHRGASKGCENREASFIVFVSKDRTWRDPDYPQTDRSPVSCVSYGDAQAYIKWINKSNDSAYRLLSEAEWQYLAKAAPAPKCKAGNLGDLAYGKAFEKDKTLQCDDGHSAPAPTGSFGQDRNGLADLTGNVREWVGDCWNSSLSAHPSSAEAWQAGNCRDRVVMGTAWISRDETQTALRKNFSAEAMNNTVGFRIARDLPASLNE